MPILLGFSGNDGGYNLYVPWAKLIINAAFISLKSLHLLHKAIQTD